MNKILLDSVIIIIPLIFSVVTVRTLTNNWIGFRFKKKLYLWIVSLVFVALASRDEFHWKWNIFFPINDSYVIWLELFSSYWSLSNIVSILKVLHHFFVFFWITWFMEKIWKFTRCVHVWIWNPFITIYWREIKRCFFYYRSQSLGV